jgi:ribosome-associated heat shock protein Hsp15
VNELDRGVPSTVRIDVWLWSVRLTPTRSAATELCRNGRVTLNGSTAKAASTVKVGDRIEARIEQRQRIVVVSELINKRVGAPVAVGCFEDHSPSVERSAANTAVLARDRGSGRPTKSDRRKIDQLRGRP